MGRAQQPKSAWPAPQRAKRLETRVTADQKALIERAAALQGRSVTDFVTASVQDAAERTIAEHEIIQLSVRDSQVLVDAILNPREPGRRMRERVVDEKR